MIRTSKLGVDWRLRLGGGMGEEKEEGKCRRSGGKGRVGVEKARGRGKEGKGKQGEGKIREE